MFALQCLQQNIGSESGCLNVGQLYPPGASFSKGGQCYPLDSTIGFPNTYPMDSDLSDGRYYPSFEQPGPCPS